MPFLGISDLMGVKDIPNSSECLSVAPLKFAYLFSLF